VVTASGEAAERRLVGTLPEAGAARGPRVGPPGVHHLGRAGRFRAGRFRAPDRGV